MLSGGNEFQCSGVSADSPGITRVRVTSGKRRPVMRPGRSARRRAHGAPWQVSGHPVDDEGDGGVLGEVGEDRHQVEDLVKSEPAW